MKQRNLSYPELTVIACLSLVRSLSFQEIKPQSHYNHGYSENVSRKNHVDDYSTWDIVKATQ